MAAEPAHGGRARTHVGFSDGRPLGPELIQIYNDGYRRIMGAKHPRGLGRPTLLGLINDVLNFAKLDAGQVEYRFEDVPVAPLMESLEELIRPQVDQKGLRYHHGMCPSDLEVRADHEKMRQVLLTFSRMP